ncbi:hypothetical protein AMIS_8080 [Actinoplanes missouriensis 431]|uniref:Uncharacterized protein n=1 Tax=Actinoplanes missouriensis (strain ATCC 14538 / DSM 43046 / CBS 188.64 / JCM 3121 / NBRC 102363 / NCIMB 12654 / NRRL B-3342 / UNCC 431) TaxID=512565 RepID=I0GZ41_ACTM4|nr:hypothetical protein AMIS_8080 [Actinoplanes missouriensis 431]
MAHDGRRRQDSVRVSCLPIRLRRLHVDGRTFVWRAEIRHVQGSGDCHRCIRVRVWGNGKTSRVRQADLLSSALPSPWGACATGGAYPTSSDLRAIITYAVGAGWSPDLGGATFVLSERAHASRFALPGFLLTDRLRTTESADPTVRVGSFHEAHEEGVRRG